MAQYKHIFGPVPSRRLSMSLGIDLVPHKTCTLNCVYCECGRTTNLTLVRKEYVKTEDVIDELNDYLYDNPVPDYITFSGSGEPTLHSDIGVIINKIKILYPEIPLAILTNGTLLSDETVRQSLLKADLVLPSLDSATKEGFLSIDRPHKALDIKEYLEGLVNFRLEFRGKIWLEVFVLPGYNDNDKDLYELKKAVRRILPDVLQINTLDRPGALPGLQPATEETLLKFANYIGYHNTEIIAAIDKRTEVRSYRLDTENAILQTVSRRPCTAVDISEILGLHLNEVNKYLGELETQRKITTTLQKRGLFYQTV